MGLKLIKTRLFQGRDIAETALGGKENASTGYWTFGTIHEKLIHPMFLPHASQMQHAVPGHPAAHLNAATLNCLGRISVISWAEKVTTDWSRGMRVTDDLNSVGMEWTSLTDRLVG